MFNKKSVAAELERSMESAIASNEGLSKVASAIDHLNIAAEMFDDLGLYREAEHATALLEVIAKKKQKSKKYKKPSKKSKSKKKPSKSKSTPDSDPSTSGLTSDKMLENLSHKGWVFNADDYDNLEVHDDFEENCEYCGKPSDDLKMIRCRCGRPLGKDCKECRHNHEKALKAGAVSCMECGDPDLDVDDNYDFDTSDDNYVEKDGQEQDLARIMRDLEKEEEKSIYEDEEEFSSPPIGRQHVMRPPPYEHIQAPEIPKFRPYSKKWHELEEEARETVRPRRY